MGQILQSEFVWGVVLGVLLSVISSWASIQLQNREQIRRVRAFVADTVRNLRDYGRSLDENRDRNGVIYNDILELIEAEIGVWGRNREHMIMIGDTTARNGVRDYLASAAKYCLETKSLLASFTESMNQTRSAQTDALRHSWEADANSKLKAAQDRADRLIKHIAQGLPTPASKYLKLS